MALIISHTDGAPAGSIANVTRPRRPSWQLAIGLLALVLASFVPIWTGTQMARPLDDGYITMVYARSIANGQGFRFYPTASPTLGTTAPLEAVILAGTWTVFPSAAPEKVVIWFSVLCWLLSGWLLVFQGASLGFSRTEAFCAGLMVLLAIFPFPYYALGMETRLFTLLLTVGAILYARKQFVLAGVASGLLFLTRGEGVLILGAFAGYELLTLTVTQVWSRATIVGLLRRGLLVASGFLIVFVPWALYTVHIFGSFLSNTLAAKSYHIKLGFGTFTTQLGFTFLALWNDLGVITINSIPVSIWMLLSVLGTSYKVFRPRLYHILLIWAFGFVVGYIVINAPGYAWYPDPFIYVMIIFSGSAVVFATALVGDILKRSKLRAFRTMSAARRHLIQETVLIGLLTLIGLRIAVSLTQLDTPFVDARWQNYVAISQWLDSNTAPTSRIASAEVGIIGWQSHRQLVDLLGLTNPELIPSLATGTLLEAFQKAAPDYLLYNSAFDFLLKPVITSDYFARHYRAVVQIAGTDDPKWAPTIIYQRQSDYF